MPYKDPHSPAAIASLKRRRKKFESKPGFKDTVRNYHLKRVFGISLEAYNVLSDSQNNLCAICKKTETRTLGHKVTSLVVDHNHETGKVRGLLCMFCNTSLGFMKEDIKILNNMINYIKKYK